MASEPFHSEPIDSEPLDTAAIDSEPIESAPIHSNPLDLIPSHCFYNTFSFLHTCFRVLRQDSCLMIKDLGRSFGGRIQFLKMAISIFGRFLHFS